MTPEEFEIGMEVLSKNYTKNIFNPSDAKMVRLWYGLLGHIDYKTFMLGIRKILVNEIFSPNLAKISQYCSEVAAPLEVDDTEGWGIVVKAINHYGYMRAEEAMKSLPYTVRKAVEYMGGIEIICQSEAPDVMRGQFNKCMAAINQRERINRREENGLIQALALANTQEEPLKLESKEFKRSSTNVTENGLQQIDQVLKEIGLRRA